jgi:hypothetical protein
MQMVSPIFFFFFSYRKKEAATHIQHEASVQYELHPARFSYDHAPSTTLWRRWAGTLPPLIVRGGRGGEIWVLELLLSRGAWGGRGRQGRRQLQQIQNVLRSVHALFTTRDASIRHLHSLRKKKKRRI